MYEDTRKKKFITNIWIDKENDTLQEDLEHLTLENLRDMCKNTTE